MSKDREGFVFYQYFWLALSECDRETQASFLQAICGYVFLKRVPEWGDGASRGLWQMFKDKLDHDTEKWEKTCAERAKAGRKGGKQTQANKSKTKQSQANGKQSQANGKQSQANQADYDLDYDLDCDLDCDCVSSCEDEENARVWQSKVMEMYKLSFAEFDKLWEGFSKYCEVINKQHEDEADKRSHFVNWVFHHHNNNSHADSNANNTPGRKENPAEELMRKLLAEDR